MMDGLKEFDFTTNAQTDDPGLPKPFKIKYMRLHEDKETETKTWREEEDKFEARPRVSTALVMQTIAAFAGSGYDSTAAVQDFLNRAITDEDRPRFVQLVDDEDVQIELRDLTSIVDWLVSEYSNKRPTKSA